MKKLWKELEKPLFVQAPMDDVTDVVFRQVLEKVGKPDIFFTEFVSTDGVCSKGRDRVMRKFRYTEGQRPIIGQIWGNNPDHYAKTAKLLQELGFDGIDINMGCPVRKVVGRGQCSGLIKNPKLAGELIQAVRSAVPDMPLSVKTRMGFNTIETEEWIGFLLEQHLDAITIHGRLASRLSLDPANWEEIGKAVQLRNKLQGVTPAPPTVIPAKAGIQWIPDQVGDDKKSSKRPYTIIIGNGDVKSREDAFSKIQTYGVDGVMIGRGIFTDLWIFNKEFQTTTVPLKTKLETLLYHIELFEKTWGHTKDFNLLKKFYKVYIADFPYASEFRQKLMELHTYEETKKVLEEEIEKLEASHGKLF